LAYFFISFRFHSVHKLLAALDQVDDDIEDIFSEPSDAAVVSEKIRPMKMLVVWWTISAVVSCDHITGNNSMMMMSLMKALLCQ